MFVGVTTLMLEGLTEVKVCVCGQGEGRLGGVNKVKVGQCDPP